MARLRCRGLDPLLRIAHARRGPRQVKPAENHRRRHRLALSQRAETRAESVSRERKGRFPMPMMQTRRRFLTTLSLAGIADLLPKARSLAAEGPLETTAVRLVADYSICSPVLLSEELLRAEGFTDVR